MKWDAGKVQIAAKTVKQVDRIIDLPDPVAHVFVDQEAMQMAVETIYQESGYMLSRMAQLEESDPALLALEELIQDSFPGSGGIKLLVEQAREEHQTTEQALEDIDGVATLTEFVVMVAASGALSAEGIGLPAGVLLACRAGKSLWDLKERVEITNEQIEELAKLANRMHWTREEFDLVWGRMVSEDRENLSEGLELELTV